MLLVITKKKLFVYHRYKFSLEKKKNQINKESQYMVSHPKTGSDSPIGSDRDRGRDIHTLLPPLYIYGTSSTTNCCKTLVNLFFFQKMAKR